MGGPGTGDIVLQRIRVNSASEQPPPAAVMEEMEGGEPGQSVAPPGPATAPPGVDAGMSTVEYAVGTVVAAAFAAVLYKIVTGDSVIAGLTNLINTALNTTF